MWERKFWGHFWMWTPIPFLPTGICFVRLSILECQAASPAVGSEGWTHGKTQLRQQKEAKCLRESLVFANADRWWVVPGAFYTLPSSQREGTAITVGLAPTSSCPYPCKGTHHFTGIADHQEMSSLCPARFLAGIPVFLPLGEEVTPASVGHPLLRAAWTWTAWKRTILVSSHSLPCLIPYKHISQIHLFRKLFSLITVMPSLGLFWDWQRIRVSEGICEGHPFSRWK